MNKEQIAAWIQEGKASIGIELGSTRIKAVLIGADYAPLASGGHSWENQLVDGIWTYRLEDVWAGLQDAYGKLADDVYEQYGVTLQTVKAMGFSAMMHGYLAFDGNGKLLVPFRTWRNTITEQAAAELTEAFSFNVPQRWTIAHLYQAILNGEPHVKEIRHLTTLAGYVHWMLTGEKVLSVGEASGVFPIDSETNKYDARMLEIFNKKLGEKGFSFQLEDILPAVKTAGEVGGTLTPTGANLLDPTGNLEPGVPLCAPEGDAGTGMVATNSIAVRTGNVSAGTSIFAMIVLEKPLSKVYPEIDMVTTPTGKPVAMVHCNNCTSDINAWGEVFRQFAGAMGVPCTLPKALDAIFFEAMKGEADCGGVLSYNYVSGEPVTGLEEGRPVFVRMPESNFSFANFARAQIYGALASLKIGMEILTGENVRIDKLLGHGGFFKAKPVGQKLMAAALETDISVMETAGEGGPWGMALLAAFMVEKGKEETLEGYLQERVFGTSKGERVQPNEEDVKGFREYIARYKAGLEVEKMATKALR